MKPPLANDGPRAVVHQRGVTAVDVDAAHRGGLRHGPELAGVAAGARRSSTLMVRFDSERQKLFSAMQPVASHWLYTSTEPLMTTSPGSRPSPATSV